MNTFAKKIIPVLFSLMLFIGVMPFGAITAYAANADTEEALVAAVNKGGTVKLSDDISLTDILRVPSGTEVKLNLNGKTLSREINQCKDNGGVIRVEPDAVLTVTDSSGNNSGTITGGASWNGGGICNHGTLYFEGGTISGNTAYHVSYGNGGGIYNAEYHGSKATLYLKGGIICNNKARNGAGVYNGKNGTVIIEQAKVTKKVGILSQTYYTNVKLTDNKASKEGSGIYNANALTVSGAPVFSENDGCDIYLASGKKITVAGELTNETKISVKATGENPVITQDYSKYNTKRPTDLFKSADTGYVVVYSSADNAELMLKNDSKTLIQVYENGKIVKREETDSTDFPDIWKTAIGYSKENKFTVDSTGEESVVEITLGSDFTHNTKIYENQYRNIIVDLNGHYIKQSGKKQEAYLFKVGSRAKLTIKDSNPNSNGYAEHYGGVLADANADDFGSGIIVQDYSQLYMEGGTIYNCKTDLHGGAVYNEGEHATIVLQNCTIDSCQTKDSGDDAHGGGIYVKNANNVLLDNVTIKNCHAEDKGGALYLRERPRNVQLNNVVFENNYADDGGGAIFIDELNNDTEFKFEADGCTFKKNRAGDRGGAVYVNDDDESDRRNPTQFRNCTFTENENKFNGAAIEVNDNGVVLTSCTITDNKTTEKGAVYVEDAYDISLGGKTIIKDNEGREHYDNLVLEKASKKAHAYSSGLYPGSEIHICSSEKDKGYSLVNSVSETQLKYFIPDYGKLQFQKTGTKSAVMVTTASVFSSGKMTVIALLLAAAAIAVCAGIIIKKRKGADSDDAEYEDE
jgi:predicted outer membrane repeat protein